MRILNYVSAALVVMVLVGCEGDARPFEEAVEVRTENLTTIAVVPPAISVPDLVMNIGETAQFGVQGTSVMGQTVTLESSDRDWQVTDESVASINDDGQLVAKSNGPVGVLVSIGGLNSITYDLNVFNANLLGVREILGESSIERCLPGDYQATGNFDDDTIRDLNGVAWTLAPADADNARYLNNPDLTVTVTGLNNEDVNLTATLDEFSLSKPIAISESLKSLSISPDSGSIEVGDVRTFAAFGQYSDAASDSDTTDATAPLRTENITASVDWEIQGGLTYASVSNSEGSRGEVTGLASGTANLSASCGNLPVETPIVVIVADSSDDNSDELSFSQSSPMQIVEGRVTTLSVSTGSVYNSDNSLDNDDLTWNFSPDNTANPAIRLQDDGVNAGQITALNAGESGTITVTDSDGASGSIRVEVTSN